MKTKHALIFGLPGIIMGFAVPFVMTYFTAPIPATVLENAIFVAINSCISCVLAILIPFWVNRKKMAALFVAEHDAKKD